jgi:hypothetical protein
MKQALVETPFGRTIDHTAGAEPDFHPAPLLFLYKQKANEQRYHQQRLASLARLEKKL